MQGKTIIKLIPTIDQASKVTATRDLECIIELDHDTGYMEYKVKIDYDQDILIEDHGETNLTYKKYEKGIVHAKDVIGLWSKSESNYILNGDSVQESFKHTLELVSKTEPLQFTVAYKDLKPTYQILKDFITKYKE